MATTNHHGHRPPRWDFQGWCSAHSSGARTPTRFFFSCAISLIWAIWSLRYVPHVAVGGEGCCFFLGSPWSFPVEIIDLDIVICLTYVCARLWNDPYLCAYMYCTHEQAANCGVCKNWGFMRRCTLKGTLCMHSFYQCSPINTHPPSIHRLIDSPPLSLQSIRYGTQYLHLRIICRYAYKERRLWSEVEIEPQYEKKNEI